MVDYITTIILNVETLGAEFMLFRGYDQDKVV